MPESEACGAYLRTVSHPALIVFDLDGTIADSRELARESYKRVFALMGFGQITDELADSFNGPDADEVCRVMGIGKDRRALYDELVDQTDVELTRSRGRMFSGTSRMLSSLSDCATMAILTNGSQRYCEACIETFAPVAARIERGCRDRRGRPSDGYSKRARGGRLRRRRDLWHGQPGGAFRRGRVMRQPAGGCGLLSAIDRRALSGCFFARPAVQ